MKFTIKPVHEDIFSGLALLIIPLLFMLSGQMTSVITLAHDKTGAFVDYSLGYFSFAIPSVVLALALERIPWRGKRLSHNAFRYVVLYPVSVYLVVVSKALIEDGMPANVDLALNLLSENFLALFVFATLGGITGVAVMFAGDGARKSKKISFEDTPKNAL